MAINTPVEGMMAIQDYLFDHGQDLPEDIRNRLRGLIKPGNSPVVASVEAAEIIYASKDDMPVELLAIAANLALMAADNNFHGMGATGRGAGIATTLRQIPGVLPDQIVPEQAPEPKSLETEEPLT